MPVLLHSIQSYQTIVNRKTGICLSIFSEIQIKIDSIIANIIIEKVEINKKNSIFQKFTLNNQMLLIPKNQTECNFQIGLLVPTFD
jgi:hypothetical protein